MEDVETEDVFVEEYGEAIEDEVSEVCFKKDEEDEGNTKSDKDRNSPLKLIIKFSRDFEGSNFQNCKIAENPALTSDSDKKFLSGIDSAVFFVLLWF